MLSLEDSDDDEIDTQEPRQKTSKYASFIPIKQLSKLKLTVETVDNGDDIKHYDGGNELVSYLIRNR